MINRKTFFDNFKPFFKRVAGKNITARQVNALDNLLTWFEQNVKWTDTRDKSYALATILIETAYTFEPIQEFGNREYFERNYYGKVKLRNQLGNLSKEDAVNFSGKGFVQLTGRTNYQKFSDLLGTDLVNNPELAKQPETAFKIMTLGMFKGLFTGKKLSDYLTPSKTDYTGARRIINGQDRAMEIALYAKEIENIFKLSANSDVATSKLPAESLPTIAEIPLIPKDEAENLPQTEFTEGEKPKELPSDATATTTKEKPSTFMKWITAVKVGVGAVIASISAYCSGSETTNLIANKAVENANGELVTKLIVVLIYGIIGLLVGVALIWIASKFYDKSAARANNLNEKKIEVAANPSLYSVNLVDKK